MNTAPDQELDGPWALPGGVIENTRLEDDAPSFIAKADGDYVELLLWRLAAKPARPDAELTVLLRLADESVPIAQGWWDGERWCLCESGGFAPEGSVLAWAEVSGPEIDSTFGIQPSEVPY